ncbi:uncharacterized protein LOC126474402 [Schistocerca serialis cubense]|uniref:uncharacterized protein LOC126474402 n=1 Tax=Schistocerca serialis cubense TaxID=2023355 RepID=UPI00214E9327|nr:uncharacterized protein LOC126474402 [Schistocerca serialis cubense]
MKKLHLSIQKIAFQQNCTRSTYQSLSDDSKYHCQQIWRNCHYVFRLSSSDERRSSDSDYWLLRNDNVDKPTKSQTTRLYRKMRPLPVAMRLCVLWCDWSKSGRLKCITKVSTALRESAIIVLFAELVGGK